MTDTSDYLEYKGIKLAIEPGVVEGRIRASIEEGWYELEESRNVPYLLQEGERVLELGSGLGYLTSIIARDRRVEHVMTFEANPQLTRLLESTVTLNQIAHKVTIHNAVAVPRPKQETCEFFLRDEFWASSMQAAPWGYRETISVPVVDINTVIAEFRPTLLVIDVEGGEAELFDEMDLGPIRKIFVELHQHAIRRTGMLHVFNTLGQRGFHYDQWHSEKSVVLFSRIDRDDPTG